MLYSFACTVLVVIVLGALFAAFVWNPLLIASAVLFGLIWAIVHDVLKPDPEDRT